MIKHIEAKSILNKTKRRDPWFLDEYTINPYRACAFNCLYCYIRGSKYGPEMEKALAVKSNAVALLDKQLALRAKKGQFGFIVVSSATDPYLKIEKELQLTKQLLEVILHYQFPVHIITKSDLVVRDIPLLQEINQKANLPDDLKDRLAGGTLISFSFSTLDDAVGKIFEPGAPPPSIRLKAVAQMQQTGLTTGISLMPLLPFISDTTKQLDHMFRTFKSMRVSYVLPATLSLFGQSKGDSKTLMLQAIAKHYPHLTEKYERFFQQSSRMPAYYQRAFDKKMKELLNHYQLADSIGRPL